MIGLKSNLKEGYKMWEKLEDPINYNSALSYSHRMRVPDGWVVRSIVTIMHESTSVHTVFVPDKEHLWKIDEKNS